MGTDARQHTAPLAGETPHRQSFNDLSLSINDFIIAANATDEASKIALLSPTTTRPVFTYRQDLDEIHRANGATVAIVASVALGTSGVWAAYTPTVAGLTSPTVTSARWCQVGKLVTVQVLIAAGGAATANITVSLPVTARTGYAIVQSVGSAAALIAGVVYAATCVEVASTTTVSFRNTNTSLWGAGYPGTWASGSTLSATVQ
jgi:hypothetical protein